MIIVGAGLAGCSLAWQSYFRNRKFALVDRRAKTTSSRIAAGLVTPITGSRAAKSWRWDNYYPEADQFYRRIESVVCRQFWHSAPALKIYSDAQERELYESKWPVTLDSQGVQRCPHVLSSEMSLKCEFGSCFMAPASRLDTNVFLDATWDYFSKGQSCFQFDLDCMKDVAMNSDDVFIPRLQIAGQYIVFCQGVDAISNLWFRLPLHPARGDILTVESKLLKSDCVVHGESWAVPLGQSQYLVGATYQRTSAAMADDSLYDPMVARDQLMGRFERMVRGSFDKFDHRIIAQRSAIRPASYDRHPLVGPHPQFANAFCFNGLGSKGSLMGPGVANHLLNSLDGHALDSNLHWMRRGT